jgi:hypothetical protein
VIDKILKIVFDFYIYIYRERERERERERGKIEGLTNVAVLTIES